MTCDIKGAQSWAIGKKQTVELSTYLQKSELLLFVFCTVTNMNFVT